MYIPIVVEFGRQRAELFKNREGQDFVTYPLTELGSGGTFSVLVPKEKLEGRHLLTQPGIYLMRLPLRQVGYQWQIDSFAIWRDSFVPAGQELIEGYRAVVKMISAEFSLPQL